MKLEDMAGELYPILAASVVETELIGPFIKHPFVNTMYMHGLEKMYNEQFDYKQQEVPKARTERQWHRYLFLHERPWRYEALVEVADEMTDPEFWECVRDVWIDSENIRENAEEWDELLRTERPGTEHLMEPEEREALAALPDEFVVWQGHTIDRDDGWSWTTRRATATWFAQRFADFEQSEAVVTRGTVQRVDVLAYLLGRNEYEILIDPERVQL